MSHDISADHDARVLAAVTSGADSMRAVAVHAKLPDLSAAAALYRMRDRIVYYDRGYHLLATVLLGLLTSGCASTEWLALAVSREPATVRARLAEMREMVRDEGAFWRLVPAADLAAAMASRARGFASLHEGR